MKVKIAYLIYVCWVGG